MVWIGQMSFSLYLWQQIFTWHSKLPWLGQFPQNIIAAFAAASLSYYLLETPLAAVRKRVPYLPNPTVQIRPEVPARLFGIRPDMSNDVLRLLNAVRPEPSTQPETQEVKSESLRS